MPTPVDLYPYDYRLTENRAYRIQVARIRKMNAKKGLAATPRLFVGTEASLEVFDIKEYKRLQSEAKTQSNKPVLRELIKECQFTNKQIDKLIEGSLPSVPYSNRDTLPEDSGIYILFHVCSGQRKVLYIGQSVNIRRRWKAHDTSRNFHMLKKLKNLEIAYVLMPSQYLDRVEMHLIKKHNPMLNVQGCKGNRSVQKAQMVWEDYIDRQLGIIA